MRNNDYTSKKRQRGVALITVLLVIALVVVIAANMTGRLQLLMGRSINAQASQQGLWAAMAGERLVFNVLEGDYEDDSSSVNLSQLWAREGMVFPLIGGALSGEIKDLQSCFNLNSLAAEDPDENTQLRSAAERQFQSLLISLEVDDYSAELLSYTVKDWVDSDKIIGKVFGAEDSTYAGKIVPYVAANTLMADVSELLAVEGMTPAIYRQIQPYVCTLPTNEFKININTIKPDNAHLLVALFEDKLGLQEAKAVINNRDSEGFGSTAEFLSTTEITNISSISDEIKEQIDIKSSYFLATLTFTFEEQNFTLNSTYQRDSKGKLHVISRKIGNNE